MYYRRLSDKEILNGFRKRDADIIRGYFYRLTFEDYLCSFDVTSDLRLQFNKMVEDVCDHAPLDRQERWIITMMLLRGFKGKRKFGAIMGQGAGLQGQSYAIPTMQGGVDTIRPYMDEFIQFAKEHPDLTFLVTRIGCGIAGFTDDDIAPLFEMAHDVENIVLPPGW